MLRTISFIMIALAITVNVFAEYGEVRSFGLATKEEVVNWNTTKDAVMIVGNNQLLPNGIDYFRRDIPVMNKVLHSKNYHSFDKLNGFYPREFASSNEYFRASMEFADFYKCKKVPVSVSLIQNSWQYSEAEDVPLEGYISSTGNYLVVLNIMLLNSSVFSMASDSSYNRWRTFMFVTNNSEDISGTAIFHLDATGQPDRVVFAGPDKCWNPTLFGIFDIKMGPMGKYETSVISIYTEPSYSIPIETDNQGIIYIDLGDPEAEEEAGSDFWRDFGFRFSVGYLFDHPETLQEAIYNFLEIEFNITNSGSTGITGATFSNLGISSIALIAYDDEYIDENSEDGFGFDLPYSGEFTIIVEYDDGTTEEFEFSSLELPDGGSYSGTFDLKGNQDEIIAEDWNDILWTEFGIYHTLYKSLFWEAGGYAGINTADLNHTWGSFYGGLGLEMSKSWDVVGRYYLPAMLKPDEIVEVPLSYGPDYGIGGEICWTPEKLNDKFIKGFSLGGVYLQMNDPEKSSAWTITGGLRF